MTDNSQLLRELGTWADIYMARSLTEFFNYLKKSDLSMLQAYALTYIYYNSPCKVSDLGEHMNVSAAATSQMIDRLEKQSMVKRMHAPQDRRIRNIVLSKKGTQFVQRSIKARQSWLKNIPSKLSEDQKTQVLRSLRILISITEELTGEKPMP